MLNCLLGALLLLHPVVAQRLRRGCVEAGGPITCESRTVIDNLANLEEAEGVCAKLVTEVFPDEAVIWNASQHTSYLDSIKEDDPWCPKVRQYYGNCLFCFDPNEVAYCSDGDQYVKCAGQPSLEEILQNKGELFQSEQDVYDICDAFYRLKTAWVEVAPWGFPVTIDFCDRHYLIKHLCPGYCDGTCFAPESHPPSCDKGSNSSKSSLTTSFTSDPWYETCIEIFDQAFLWADWGSTKLSVENQTEYLRVIQDDSHLGPNKSFCLKAREAYSHCVWCAEEQCFGDHWPTSCETPPDFYTKSKVIGFGESEICEALYFATDDVNPDGSIFDWFNVSSYQILLAGNNDFCDQARLTFHRCWWCAPHVIKEWETLNQIHYSFCGVGTACGSPVELPSDFESITLNSMGLTLLDPFTAQNDSQVSCEEIYQQYMANRNNMTNLNLYFSLIECFDEIYLGRLCPVQFCGYEQPKTIDKNYLGATTTAQKRALIWLSRVSAILSFAGALYIILDCLKDVTKRKLVYHQLLVGMAVFDMVTAFAWAFATLPIDKEEAGHVEGAKGNEATCMAQAFFVQLGLTSVFYNVSLSLYYLLVIAYDWREFQLQKINVYLHAVPIVLGLGLAFGGIPVYHWFEYACHILPPPEGDLWASLVFVVLPLGFAIVAITGSMLLVYLKVRQRTAASNKWSLGIGGASKLEQAVFWQCVFYVLAFYVSWPLLFAVYLASVDVNGPVGLTLTVAFLAPLQGFSNFIVYIRPKLMKPDKKTKPRRSSQSKDGAPRSSGRNSTIRKLIQIFPRFDSSALSASVPRSTAADDVDLSQLDNTTTRAAGVEDVFEPVSLEMATHSKQTPPTITAAAPTLCEPAAAAVACSPHEMDSQVNESLVTESRHCMDQLQTGAGV